MIRSVTVAVLLSATLVVVDGGVAAHAADDGYVRPFDPGRFTAGLPGDADSVRARAILNNANRFALAVWYPRIKNYDAQTGSYLSFGGVAEANIRPPASQAYALAVSLATGGYDAAATGISEASARATAAKLARSVALQHRANTAGGWGNGWQSALWAAMAGNAAWLLWPELSTSEREYTRRMIEFEANRFIGWPVPYWRNRSGALNGACGDTKAEESSWNARLLFLAGAMLSQHSRRSGWAYKASELSIGAFARPADLTSTSDMRGRPLADWLEGTNVSNDGSLVNHSRYHPDYTTTVTEMISGALTYALAGEPIPTNGLRGTSLQYDLLVDKQWWPAPALPCPESPAFLAPTAANPTGTMYIDGATPVHYPQPNDWGTSRRAHFAQLDITVRAFGLDSLVAEKAVTWEALHAAKALQMQQRALPGGAPSDGSTYRTSTEDTYSGREEWVAARAAEMWLVKWLSHQGFLGTANGAEQIVIDNSDRGVSIAGTWTNGSPAANGPQVFGPSVRYKAAGNGSSYVRFAPRMTQTRTYRVYAWWNAAPAQATNTPFTVNHATGSTVVTRDQRSAGGSWQQLGTFSIGPGDYVQVSDNANGYVVADAVLFDPS
ncbi:MAG TPA: hypothetical protein VF062_01615 [Candidatus Limnocylindrales bacterium]